MVENVMVLVTLVVEVWLAVLTASLFTLLVVVARYAVHPLSPPAAPALICAATHPDALESSQVLAADAQAAA